MNRVIKKYDLDMIYVPGPGHGGPAVVGNTYLEGSYSEIYPNVSQDEAGLRKLFLQFLYPGGIPSHASAECPGSIHKGGELGYSLMLPRRLADGFGIHVGDGHQRGAREGSTSLMAIRDPDQKR